MTIFLSLSRLSCLTINRNENLHFRKDLKGKVTCVRSPFKTKISHAFSTNNTWTSLMDAAQDMRFILKSMPLKSKCHSCKVWEQTREENATEDSGNQHGSRHHTSCDLILWICLWPGRVHHGQRAQVAWRITHNNGKAPVDIIVIDVNRKIARDSQRMIVAEKEQRDEGSTENYRPNEESRSRLWRKDKISLKSVIHHLSTHPFHPRCGQTAKHGKYVERKETCDRSKQLFGHDSEKFFVRVWLLDFWVEVGKDCQCHEKDEEDIEKLHEGFLEDSPVGRACVNVNAGTTCLLLLLLAHHLMIAVEFVQRHGKVCVKAEKNDEHGSDEVINGRFAHRRPNRAGKDADDGGKGSTDVWSEHDSAGVFGRKLGCHSVCRVLENPTGHVKHDNRSHCHPEEGSGPCWRVNHRQNYGDEKDYDFYDQTPHDTFCEIAAVE